MTDANDPQPMSRTLKAVMWTVLAVFMLAALTQCTALGVCIYGAAIGTPC